MNRRGLRRVILTQSTRKNMERELGMNGWTKMVILVTLMAINGVFGSTIKAGPLIRPKKLQILLSIILIFVALPLAFGTRAIRIIRTRFCVTFLLNLTRLMDDQVRNLINVALIYLLVRSLILYFTSRLRRRRSKR